VWGVDWGVWVLDDGALRGEECGECGACVGEW
jgi:hypothetical protein